MNNPKAAEQRLRRFLNRRGYRLVKSKARNYSYYNQLGYMIVNNYYNLCVAGSNYSLSLEEAMDFAGMK